MQSLRAVSAGLDAGAVLERTAREARRLFVCDAAIVLTAAAGEPSLQPAASDGLALGPLSGLRVALDDETSPLAAAARDLVPVTASPEAGTGDALTRELRPSSLLAVPLVVAGRLHALLVLIDLGSSGGFAPGALGRAAVFADFAARAAENAALFDRVDALLAQARIRESERAELSRRVVSAEQ
ncbi:MAG TPA: GAF domain-containing protein, partial [Gemmatimonadaceae bacterium]|nr:GAF domain-containing protein [Gemmatimonadaceae bacterium]